MARRHFENYPEQGIRRKGKGKIKHTKVKPKWERDLHSAANGLRREFKNFLAGAGFVVVVYLIIKAIG